MFESDYFDNNVSDVSVRRGLEVYNEHKILSLELERNTLLEDRVSAQVQGSGSIIYEPELYIDLDSEQVNDSWCDCPAFRSFPGLCKHCVAVLIAYKMQKQGFSIGSSPPNDIRKKTESSW